MFHYVGFVIRGFRRRYSDNHRVIRRTYVRMHIYMQVETAKETPILSDAAVTSRIKRGGTFTEGRGRESRTKGL